MLGCFFQPRCQTVSANNPLLQSYDLPPFSAIRADHVKPAIEQILADNRTAIAEILVKQGKQPTWAGLILAMDELNDRLGAAPWRNQSYIHSFSGEPTIRLIKRMPSTGTRFSNCCSMPRAKRFIWCCWRGCLPC